MKKLLTIFFSCLTFLMLPTFVYAYVDPGTGSLILQGLAAGLILVAAFWRKILKALRNFFNKKDQ